MEEVVGRGARAPEPALALRAKPASGLDATRFDQAQGLLPCPFCGGEAQRYTAAVGRGFENRQVNCRCCGASAFDLKWQKRVSDGLYAALADLCDFDERDFSPPPMAKIERARAALARAIRPSQTGDK